MITMYIEIITPDNLIYSGNIISVKLPGSEGSFGVLKNHAPIISSLTTGEIKVVDEHKATHTFRTSGGVVEVLNNKVTVLTEKAEE